MDFKLNSEYIELNKLLKATAIVESGGIAGLLIKDEQVLVNGKIETRKRCKIRAGQVITVLGTDELIEVI